MTAPPTTDAIRERVLAVLRDRHPEPASTREVTRAIYDLVHAYPGAVYQQLIILTQAGRVERANAGPRGEVRWLYAEREPGR